MAKLSLKEAPSSSSLSSLGSAPDDAFSSLPVVAMKERIVEKIMENRVTLIVGETGCGLFSLYCFVFLGSVVFIMVVCCIT